MLCIYIYILHIYIHVGQTNRSTCVCNSGFYEADGVDGNCTLCGEDTFCANDKQIACPRNS